jgi:2-iminobutanoate/2-iminopropanoate deaminase
MKAVATEQAPGAIGPYSQAIEANGFLFVSGQLPIDPKTGVFAGDDIKSQTKQALLNAKAILEAAGSGMAKVCKTTVFLADIKSFAEMNAVYGTFFNEPFPARAAFEVAELPKGAMVEIEMIAVK